MSDAEERPPIPVEFRPGASRKGVLLRLIDTIGNVWFGITMMVLVLLFCWIGSAGFAPFLKEGSSRIPVFVRQYFEKTEMEWFSWWPFQVVLGLLCLSLILVTIRRIPFRLANAGVLTVHLGILVLAAGSTLYFGKKIEGEAPVYRREAILSAADGEPKRLVLRMGEKTTVSGKGMEYHVEVRDLNSEYTLLTGEDKGKKTYSAMLMIRPVKGGQPGEPFIRQVLDGYPQFTEDVLPGKGRVFKLTGNRLHDEDLSVRLQYAATDEMFLQDRPALHVRKTGDEAWTELPIHGLPRYHEHVSSRDQIWVSPAEEPPPIRAIDIPLRPKKETPPLDADLSFRVTGFLPFAGFNHRWEPGGPRRNPYLRYTMEVGGRSVEDELFAYVPSHSRRNNGLFDVSFVWIDDASELERLILPDPPSLRVSVAGGPGVKISVPASAQDPMEVGDTGYRVQFEFINSNWSVAGDERKGESVAMAMVRVTDPNGKSFRRAVISPYPEMSQDLDDEGTRHTELLDPNIRIEFENVPRVGLTFVGGGVGTHALLTSDTGEVKHRVVTVGEPFNFLGRPPNFTVADLIEDPTPVVKPQLIPARERNVKAKAAYSMIRVEIRRGTDTRSEWIEYSHFNHPSRLGYFPLPVDFQDGSQLEMIYSRETRRLEAPVVLEDFVLEQFPGRDRERDYISLVRFAEADDWSRVHEVRSNQPTAHKGWWYFQSTWDPPNPEQQYVGKNYTGLGIGNRHGVGMMLLGSIMTVVGTFFAFYVKPLILRSQARRRAMLRASRDGSGEGKSRAESTVTISSTGGG